jgi:hypothetical protein
MPPKRLTINNMPLRSGLATAGKQGTIGENQLWQAKNMSSGLDGLLFKRPGIRKWGQTIKQPRPIDTSTGELFSFYEAWANTEAWVPANGDASSFFYSTSNGELTVSALGVDSGSDVLSMTRGIYGSEVEPTVSDFSIRFVSRSLNMPRGDGLSGVAGSDFTGGSVTVFGRALSSNTPVVFRLHYDGVYHYNSVTAQWERIAASDIGDGQYHVIEIRTDYGTSYSVYVDEVLTVSTIAASYAYDAGTMTMSGGDHMVFMWTAGTEIWTNKITDLMFKDSITAPFTGQRINAVTDFKTNTYSNRVERSLLAATSTHVYADIGLRMVWRPILVLTGGQPQFASYRQDIVIFDGDNSNSAKVYKWDGKSAPTPLLGAPPVRFGTEHGTRLWASGDKAHPRRVYFTASREPDVWFYPESDGVKTYEEVTEAGYHEIPGQRGDVVTGVYGDFSGFCFITTTRGLWAISGLSPETFDRKDVSRSQNGMGPNTITRVGNDLWTLGSSGVTGIQTTQNYGDLLTVLPSGPIGNLWGSDPNTPGRIDQGQLGNAVLAYNSALGLVYMLVPQVGQQDMSAIYCFNVGLQTWYGPWTTDTTALASVEISDPVTNVMLHGSSDGFVGITDSSYKMDYGTTSYTALVESPHLNGRSLDPSLTKLTKTWKVLRLYLHPRGNWNLIVRWSADDDDADQTITENQNTFDRPCLDDTFRLDDPRDGRILSEELIGVVEIALDARGRYFRFSVETEDSEDGEDLVLQGYEVDFVPNGVEEED